MFFKSTASSNQPEKTFYCRSRGNAPETHPINGHSESKKLNKLKLCSVRKPATFPYRFKPKTSAATTAFQSAIGKFPGSGMLTFCTSYHS
jgi:hypothetical protein